MTDLTVIDTASEDLAGLIASRLSEYNSGGDILIRSVASFHEITQKKPDILVLTEEAVLAAYQQKVFLISDILLMPGDVDAFGAGPPRMANERDIFDASCIVTYGMSPKNTITLSSISEESCVLALQRELVTVYGDVLERQEIKIKGGMRPELLLAVSGALLILGKQLSDSNP